MQNKRKKNKYKLQELHQTNSPFQGYPFLQKEYILMSYPKNTLSSFPLSQNKKVFFTAQVGKKKFFS